MSTTTKQRGISFSGPMVTAIAAGVKTQTRRTASSKSGVNLDKCPHHVGEVLYVKEGLQNIGGWVAYAADSQCAFDEDAECLIPWKWKPNRLPGIYMPRRCARHFIEITGIRVERLQEISAADILAEGAVSRSHNCEAFAAVGANPKCPVSAFDGCAYPDLRSLWAAGWISLNGKDSWDANPWVWVYEFRKVSR